MALPERHRLKGAQVLRRFSGGYTAANGGGGFAPKSQHPVCLSF
jgi:hypothetical protein